jgi:hypothetical protein
MMKVKSNRSKKSKNYVDPGSAVFSKTMARIFTGASLDGGCFLLVSQAFVS